MTGIRLTYEQLRLAPGDAALTLGARGSSRRGLTHQPGHRGGDRGRAGASGASVDDLRPAAALKVAVAAKPIRRWSASTDKRDLMTAVVARRLGPGSLVARSLTVGGDVP
jgi:hypothetical protein